MIISVLSVVQNLILSYLIHNEKWFTLLVLCCCSVCRTRRLARCKYNQGRLTRLLWLNCLLWSGTVTGFWFFVSRDDKKFCKKMKVYPTTFELRHYKWVHDISFPFAFMPFIPTPYEVSVGGGGNYTLIVCLLVCVLCVFLAYRTVKLSLFCAIHYLVLWLI